MDPLTLLGAFAGLLGLVGVVVAAFVVARSSATKAAAEAWRGEAEAQKARGDRLEEELLSIKARVTALELDNTRLKDLATGASAIRELGEIVTRQHDEIKYLIGTMTTAPTRRTETETK